MKRLVLHIGLTAVAHAPIRLTKGINKYSNNFTARFLNFRSQEYTYEKDLSWEEDKEEALTLIRKADILHFHHPFNLASEDNPFKINFIKENSNAKIINHLHSSLPQFRCENYQQLQNIIGINNSFLVCPPQAMARYYQNAYLLPNIIDENNNYMKPLDIENKKVRVLVHHSSFTSVYQKSRDRWAKKGAKEVIKELKKIQKKYSFEIVQHKGGRVKLDEALALKQSCDIVIDDICQGSFHLNSLEGLSQGKVVLSYVDNCVLQDTISMVKTREFPIVNVRIKDLKYILKHLVTNKDLRKNISKYSRYWIEKYYNIENNIKMYEDFYLGILSGKISFNINEEIKYNKAKEFLYQDIQDIVSDKYFNNNIRKYKLKLQKLRRKLKLKIIKILKLKLLYK